jgi:hypothetical protein
MGKEEVMIEWTNEMNGKGVRAEGRLKTKCTKGIKERKKEDGG